MTVGQTRIVGKAGPLIDLAAFLAENLRELSAPVKREAGKVSYGTGADAVDTIYADTITLAQPNGGGETETLNLYDSATLEDIFHQALTMAALKLLYIKNNSADATLLLFGGEADDIEICATNADVVKVPPGGEFMWKNFSADGLDISTNKNLKIEHDGTGTATMAVDIVAMGVAAT